jgi:uncharacterized protein YraI
MRRSSSLLVTLIVLAFTATVAAVPAGAEPATTVSYPAGATATRYHGLAFDACDAPTRTTMRAWTSSPYGAVGIYIGGPNRTCSQRNLTASWVTAVSWQGWRLVPIYMGRQAPCTHRVNAVEIQPARAGQQGTAAASDAVGRAAALGLRPGSALYADMEHYDDDNAACRTAVLRYLSAWTKELHRRGYLSGVYAHLYSGARHLSDAYASTTYARPDALWIARWDLNSALRNWEGIANSKWANMQRGKQYRGDHNETHGGVTINIDNDRFNAPVATVAYTYHVTSSTPLNARSGPSTAYPVVRSYAPGANLPTVCQTPGSRVGTTGVWNKLTNGAYVTDFYVDTPSDTSYSAPLPRCTYPFQVSATGRLNERTGPGMSFPVVRSLPSGALAWIVCQRAGSRVANTSVWDRLRDGYYVTDNYVATPSKTTYSRPLPRC